MKVWKESSKTEGKFWAGRSRKRIHGKLRDRMQIRVKRVKRGKAFTLWGDGRHRWRGKSGKKYE